MDEWPSGPPVPVDNALSQLLAELEDHALTVYAQAGLPTQQGHYARAPGDTAWQFVAEHLPPSDRWALVQTYPPEQGWRFGTLRTLGAYEPATSPAVLASQVLTECQAVKDSPEARFDGTVSLLERAIRLGITSTWLGLGASGRPAGPEVSPQPGSDGQGDLFKLPGS